MTSSLLAILLASMAPGAGASLTVTVTGLEHDGGTVRVALHAAAEGFPAREHALRKGTASIAGGTATWRIDALPPGAYAVSAFHDENGNGELDKHAIGAPREAYGFSNDARGRFGPPRWEEARLQLSPGENHAAIRVR